MPAMIAYCGLACESCPIHLATVELDARKKQQMRITIARICRERYGMKLQPEEVTDCDGCRSVTGRLFASCSACEIRKCAQEKKLESCAYCYLFACEKLQKLFTEDHDARARLEILRSACNARSI